MPVTTQNAASRWKKLSDVEWEKTQRIGACVDSFESGIGRDFRENCVKWYRQWRGFKRFRNAWEKAGPNDKDGLLLDAKKTWGANLHIPMTYRTIEHMVPAAISQRPKMLYLPRQPEFEENVANVQLLHDAQMEQIDIELRYQDIMRAGLIYGLGVGKGFWRKEYAYKREMRRKMFRDEYAPSKLLEVCIFDDPDYEDVDVFDFMWDPFAGDMRSCSWAIHRLWLSTEACVQRLNAGVWNTDAAKQLTEDDIRGMGGREKYDEVWADRMEASGFPSFQVTNQERGEQIHELWEWHDGNQVCQVLDRQVYVQEGESPCVGMQPFDVYRPTRVPKQMVGIGEVEPLEHLQKELDTLRSQRRDAATLALCAGYAYDSSVVDEEDITWGPFSLIAVRNADPRTAVQPLQRQEVPGTALQDEMAVRNDMDLVSGIQDALAGGDGANASTATEMQLVQASVAKRIELKSRRFEVEIVRGSARRQLKLNQRMISAPRPPMRQPDPGLDPYEAAQTGRWQWFELGPGELRGDMEIIPEGGSMAAPNIQQNIQLAQTLMALGNNNPFVDPKQPLMRALQLLGEKHPQAWLKQAEPPVPPLVFQILQDMGMDPRVIQHAIQQAQQQDPQLNPEQQGPDVQAVDQQMQGAPQ